MIKLSVVFIVFIVAVKLEPASSKNACRDDSINCSTPRIAKQCRYNTFIRNRCRKTCNVCGSSSTGSCKSCNCWSCLNGGTCFIKDKNPTCSCPSGYSGSHCHFKGEVECKTIAGPSKNKDCVFPFVFNGTKYNKCAFDSDGFWCSTKVDSTGSHISGNWGICGSDCPKDICDSNPCMNGGICNADGSGNYSCNCSKTNFQGANCTDVINPTCDDGIMNQEETGIDCGGPCPACPTCDDGIMNQGETGIDCGGPCPACPTCNDGIVNQGETGIDCGGPCAACPTCDDGIMNQEETGIDCGGPCAACPTCDDGIMNQLETGIDCGGPCPACPTCDDGIVNQGETGIDCGGPCPACQPCKDASTKCARFVPKYCTINKKVMENCKASCGICNPPTSPKNYPSTTGLTTNYPSTAPITAAPTTDAPISDYPSTPKNSYPTTIETTKYPTTSCKDISSKCNKFTKACNKNSYVTNRCQKTCGNCG